MKKMLIVAMLLSNIVSLNAMDAFGLPDDLAGGQVPDGMFDPLVGGDLDPAEIIAAGQQLQAQPVEEERKIMPNTPVRPGPQARTNQNAPALSARRTLFQ